MTDLSKLILEKAAFDIDKTEDRSAYFHLDNPRMTISQSYYEGERIAYDRLRPLIVALAERSELLSDLYKRIRLNGGIGEYQGGRPFIMGDIRESNQKLREVLEGL